MSLTPNFGFNIPTGTDTVNLLTQCYPNFTALDNYLQDAKDNGVTTASCTKSGTNFQLVRTVSSCNIMRFVATGNYASGDTFTVDGSPVTATTPAGTSLDAGSFVINQSVVAVLNGSVLTVMVSGSGTVAAQDVTYDNTGSGLTATDVQDAIDEVLGDIPANASALSYDNTGSGLTATNVQDAIDEVAGSSGGSNHGLYEIWVNPTPSSSFAAQTVTATVDDLSTVDAFIFVVERTAGELHGAEWRELEKDLALDGSDHRLQIIYMSGTTPKYVQRAVTTTAVGNTLSFDFTAGQDTGTASNTSAVPAKIMVLKHNTF